MSRPYKSPDEGQTSLFSSAGAPRSVEPSFPFRLEERECPAEELALINAPLPKEQRYRSASQDLTDISSISRFLQMRSEHLMRWLSHPDERVPLTILQRRAHSLEVHGNALRLIYTRALREADQEGALWTPLLDSLLADGIWQERYREKDGEVETATLMEGAEEMPSRAELAERVVPWIRQCTDADQIARFYLGFRSQEVRALVCRHAPALSAEMVDSLITNPARAEDLAQNQNLSAAAARTAHAALVRDLRQGGGMAARDLCTRGATALEMAGHPVPAELLADAERMLGVSMGRTGDPATTGNALQYLAERVDYPEARLLEVLEPFLQGHGPSLDPGVTSALVRRPNRSPSLTKALLSSSAIAENLVHAVLYYPEADVGLLTGVYGLMRIRNRTDQLATLAGHPSADADLLRSVAYESRSSYVRDALAKSEVAARDPEIRELLGRSSSVPLLEALARTYLKTSGVPADDVTGVLKRLFSRSPERAVEVLESHPLPVGLGLAPEDWLPLFQADDAVRERARSVFSRYGATAAAPTPVHLGTVDNGPERAPASTSRTRRGR